MFFEKLPHKNTEEQQQSQQNNMINKNKKCNETFEPVQSMVNFKLPADWGKQKQNLKQKKPT